MEGGVEGGGVDGFSPFGAGDGDGGGHEFGHVVALEEEVAGERGLLWQEEWLAECAVGAYVGQVEAGV